VSTLGAGVGNDVLAGCLRTTIGGGSFSLVRNFYE
jgi:hypothetical protein